VRWTGIARRAFGPLARNVKEAPDEKPARAYDRHSLALLISSDTSMADRGNPGRSYGETLMKRSLFVVAAVLSFAVGASYADAQTSSGGTHYGSDAGHALSAGTIVPISFTPGASACPAALNALNLSWEHQGFDTPTKPAQMRVSGSDGNAISGQAYGYVTEQMRQAAADEQSGNFTDCLKSVRRARADLPSSSTLSERI
jgi:hypothetical protein